MKSSDFITPVSTKPKQSVTVKPVVETQQRKRTSMLETLLNVDSKYRVTRDQRIAESMHEDAEANRILRSMTGDGDEDQPVKHTKHSKHETHGAENPYDKIDYKSPFKKERELQPKQADTKPDTQPEKPTEPENKPEKKKEKKHYLSVEPFKQVAGTMGEDLYALSDYEYHYENLRSNITADNLPQMRSDAEPVMLNRVLLRTIQNLGTEMSLTHEIRDFLNQDRENFWHGGSIHAVILNDKTGQIFFFVADPGADFSTLASGGFVSVQKRVPHGLSNRNLTREQERILDNVKNLGDQYVKYGRRTINTNYKHGYSEAVELRRQLLNALGLGEGYVPPLDRDPQDIEAEREHKRKKAQNEPGHTAKPTSTT